MRRLPRYRRGRRIRENVHFIESSCHFLQQLVMLNQILLKSVLAHPPIVTYPILRRPFDTFQRQSIVPWSSTDFSVSLNEKKGLACKIDSTTAATVTKWLRFQKMKVMSVQWFCRRANKVSIHLFTESWKGSLSSSNTNFKFVPTESFGLSLGSMLQVVFMPCFRWYYLPLAVGAAVGPPLQVSNYRDEATSRCN